MKAVYVVLVKPRGAKTRQPVEAHAKRIHAVSAAAVYRMCEGAERWTYSVQRIPMGFRAGVK